MAPGWAHLSVSSTITDFPFTSLNLVVCSESVTDLTSGECSAVSSVTLTAAVAAVHVSMQVLDRRFDCFDQTDATDVSHSEYLQVLC